LIEVESDAPSARTSWPHSDNPLCGFELALEVHGSGYEGMCLEKERLQRYLKQLEGATLDRGGLGKLGEPAAGSIFGLNEVPGKGSKVREQLCKTLHRKSLNEAMPCQCTRGLSDRTSNGDYDHCFADTAIPTGRLQRDGDGQTSHCGSRTGAKRYPAGPAAAARRRGASRKAAASRRARGVNLMDGY
jgi:hypothetical protein